MRIQYTDTKKPANSINQYVETDPDGWYMYSFKYTGKPATFTVTLQGTPDYAAQQQTVTLKSNGYLVVDFIVADFP